MSKIINQQTKLNNSTEQQDSLVETVNILSDITRRDIEKSYNIDNSRGIEAYYSNRYGWTLRRAVD